MKRNKIIETSLGIFQVQRPDGTFWKIIFNSYEQANESLYKLGRGFKSPIHKHVNRKLREAKRIAGLD